MKAARLWMGSLWLCTWAASAQAEECERNEDCPQGWSCEVSTSAVACADAPACQPEEMCPLPEPCGEPTEVHTCQPATCATDADCGERMVCFKEMLTACSAGAGAPACAPGDACAMPAAPDEPTCTEQEIALCVPRHALPCQEDSDCGEGFSCEAGEECMCSGSGGAAADGGPAAPSMDGAEDFAGFVPTPVDAGVDAPVVNEDAAVSGKAPICECWPSERKHCELRVKTCSSDQDCPSGFACVTSGDGASVSCTRADGGDAVCETVAVEPAEKRCESRYGWPSRGADSSSDGPTYGADGEEHDAGVAAPQLPGAGEAAAPVDDTGSCSVTTPRAGRLGSLIASFGVVLLALGLRARRKQR